MFRFQPIAALALLTGMFVLTSCAGHEGLKAGLYKSVDTPASPVVEKIQVSVTPAPPDPQPNSLDYQVGIGDVLSVMVYARPDLSTGTATGGGTVGSKGSRVDGSGNIHLPLIGSVTAAGMTVSVIRDKVETSLRKYVQEPSVVVEVAEFHSKPIYLMGQFRTPGVYYMDRPMTLLQGITMGNGFDNTANLRGVRLLRDQKIAPVDVYSLILDGHIEQNVWLRAGDTVFIPDNRTQNVFVFGAVNKPGPQPMAQGRMDILAAIASADPRTVGLDLKNVRIIRSLTTTTGELLVVDVESIRRGEVLMMQLIEGDVVYVPKNAFGTWNDIIGEILPSLQAVSALLQPFVSIQYLRNN
ncbi:MAG: polysaccharide biosynthesis/export family protein [Verrucomicrobia bacterium]|nr:polysaccharide biosynthesis/export family protein [Deltaproteobacteria bacterium]